MIEKRYRVVWSVTERVNGPGRHDGGVREGDRSTVAEGDVIKEAMSANALRSELADLLRTTFPEHERRGTYDLDRAYRIDITEV